MVSPQLWTKYRLQWLTIEMWVKAKWHSLKCVGTQTPNPCKFNAKNTRSISVAALYVNAVVIFEKDDDDNNVVATSDSLIKRRTRELDSCDGWSSTRGLEFVVRESGIELNGTIHREDKIRWHPACPMATSSSSTKTLSIWYIVANCLFRFLFQWKTCGMGFSYPAISKSSFIPWIERLP